MLHERGDRLERFLNMKKVVICGGGIIGCSIAYYLSKADHDLTKIILVERNEIAGHASGKAGGFLGKSVSK